MFKKTLLATSIISVLALSGCTTIPSNSEISTFSRNNAEDQVRSADEWMQDPAVRVVYSNVGTQVRQQAAIPSNIRNKPVDIMLMPNSTLNDLLTAISLELEISAIAENAELADLPVYIPRYSGTLGGLLDTIAVSKDISFDYKFDSIILKNASSYMITLPQDTELLSTVESELDQIGAKNVKSSVSSGVVFYETSLRNQEKIETYLDRIANNSALITLQVMVINVSTERDRRRGFDWSSFQAKIGDFGVISAGSSGSSGNGGGSSTGDATTDTGVGARITGNSMLVNLSRSSIDIAGLFSLLSTYGKATTNQDVSLKTISGKEVILDSYQEIPYVSDVRLSTTDTGVSNSGLDTDTARNGLTMNFLPHYDADSQLISIDVDIQLETLLGFMELSAGNQFGTITQPRTQRQAFNNTIRTPVGDSVILGGITYESISDNRATISPLDTIRTASENYNLTTNSLFIVIRPTVVLYRSNTTNEERE